MAVTTIETTTWARRMLALIVDWFASTLVVVTFVGPAAYYGESGGLDQLYVFAVYLVEASILTAFVGGSFGQLATRLRVVRVADSGFVSLPLSFVRHAMVLLVIPPLVYRPDGRGLHDMVAGSATVTLATYRERRGLNSIADKG